MSEDPEDGKLSARAVFDMDGFKIGDEEYDYNHAYPYKEIPEMLSWLKEQNMVMPRIKLFDEEDL